MVEEIPEEDGYWELIEEDSPSCVITPPTEEEEFPLLPVIGVVWQVFIGIFGGMFLLGR